jgi:hypothetical protein
LENIISALKLHLLTQVEYAKVASTKISTQCLSEKTDKLQNTEGKLMTIFADSLEGTVN